MNRQDFYLNLALELNKLKVPPELINTHIDQFKQYLQTLTEADAERQIASFGDIKELAANIYRLLCGGEDAPAPVETPAPAEEESLYDAFRVEEDEGAPVLSELTPEQTVIADAVLPEEQLAQEPAPEELPEEEEAEEEVELDFDLYDTGDYVAPDLAIFDEIDDSPVGADGTPVTPAPESPPATPEETVEEPLEEPFEEFTFDDLPKHVHKPNRKGSFLFWGGFTLALPITLPLFIAAMALFGFGYVVLALAVALTFLCIFASAIGGALLALTGGLYGVTQLTSGGLAIGLFELGMALAITGITILAAFIFSVISLRALPALMKYLTLLLRLFLRKLLELIDYLKGRCVRS